MLTRHARAGKLRVTHEAWQWLTMGQRTSAQLESQPPVDWGLGPTWVEDLVATAHWDGLLSMALASSKISILGDV